MAAGPVRLREISRIDELGRHDQERVAAGNVEAIEIFRHDGVAAVRHAVPAQIARLHLRGHDLERAPTRAATRKESGAQRWRRPIPAGGRDALPVAALAAGGAERDRPRLRTGVALDLQSLI